MKYLFKNTDRDVTGSTVLVTDSDLTFPLLANSTYLIRGQLRFKGPTVGGMKHTFTAGGATLVRGSIYVWKWRYIGADTLGEAEENGASWGIVDIAANTTRNVAMSTGAYSLPMKFIGMLEIGATPGNFGIQFAQNSVGATATTLQAGSLLIYEKLP